MFAKTCLLLAMAAGSTLAMGPTWFFKSQDSSLDQAARNDVCQGLFDAGSEETFAGGFYFPADYPSAEICVNFPPIPEKNLDSKVTHSQGKVGACVNGCCKFLPPLKKSVEPKYLTWFEAGDCASPPAETNQADFLFQGSNGDAKSICIQLEDGSFNQEEGRLDRCSGKCCELFLAPKPGQ